MWLFCFFLFKPKTAYEMRISDWSSDVCSSDLLAGGGDLLAQPGAEERQVPFHRREKGARQFARGRHRAMVFLRPVRRLDDEVHQAGGRREETVLRLSALRQRPLPGDGAEGGDRAIPRQIYARLGRAAPGAVRAAEEDGDRRPGRDAAGAASQHL